MKTPLSERIRPNSEAAPWVIDEVKELEKQNTMMLEALEKFTKIEYAMGKDLIVYGNTYVPEEWLQFLTIARDIIANVKGENQ
jgi:hypothetical protein